MLDIFILKDYCTQDKFFNASVDEYDNIEIYFMFYFDFRGRYYLHSPVSPTSNKFCRLILNYGVSHVDELKNKITFLSKIIHEYMTDIQLIKDKFFIKNNSSAVNESIFWLMISISKFTIDKSKENSIKDAIRCAFRTINNPDEIQDIADIAEFNYNMKTLKSLKNDLFLKRCVIKDATASFFQNLIRILGARDDETRKIANLLSLDRMYD